MRRLWKSAFFDKEHQAHFTPDFVPGGAQNLPTRRTFAGFSHLVFVDGGYLLVRHLWAAVIVFS